jgi:hypothetical protein
MFASTGYLDSGISAQSGGYVSTRIAIVFLLSAFRLKSAQTVLSKTSQLYTMQIPNHFFTWLYSFWRRVR